MNTAKEIIINEHNERVRNARLSARLPEVKEGIAAKLNRYFFDSDEVDRSAALFFYGITSVMLVGSVAVWIL